MFEVAHEEDEVYGCYPVSRIKALGYGVFAIGSAELEKVKRLHILVVSLDS